MTMLRSTFIGAALLVGLSGVMVMGQRQGGSVPPPQQPPTSTRPSYPPSMGPPMGGMDPMSGPDVLNSRMADQQARSRNRERQRRLESDTEKLVGLVTD